MRADKVFTVTATIAAAAMATFAASLAASPPANAQDAVVVRHHGPVRVTVHRRSYLHPGTETKAHAEHYSDYYYSPSHGLDPMRNSTLFYSGAGLPYVHDRMPMPNCLDLAGFCR